MTHYILINLVSSRRERPSPGNTKTSRGFKNSRKAGGESTLPALIALFGFSAIFVLRLLIRLIANDKRWDATIT